jgi:Septum formation
MNDRRPQLPNDPRPSRSPQPSQSSQPGSGWVPSQGPPSRRDWIEPPPDTGPEWTYKPPRNERTAVWALVCGILAFIIPLIPAVAAFILAAIAKRRIKADPQVLTGTGMVTAARITAVIGLIVNLAAIGIGGGLLLVANQLREQATVKTAPIALSAGDCVQDAGNGQLAAAQVIDCATAHDLEVFANLQVPQGNWPGSPALAAEGAASCGTAFAEYVGIPADDSALAMRYLTPGQQAWAQGDRTISCAVENADGSPLTGSVRGARR